MIVDAPPVSIHDQARLDGIMKGRTEAKALGYPGEIVTVEVRDRKRTLGRATGVSFATGFVAIGVACGADAKYNNDYQGCLAISAVLGAAAGLVGLAVGAIVDASHPGTYHFDRMDPAEKRKTVQRLLAR